MAAERRFVLQPLTDVWPDAVVGDELTATQALAAVADQRVDRLASEWADPSATPPGRYWVGIQFVWFLAVALVMAVDGSLPGESPEGTRLIGGLLVVVGGLLAFLSVRKLGRSLTAVPEPLTDADLIESGPYALVRHPIYGGVVLLLLGTSLVLDSLWGTFLTIGLLGFFWMKSTYEERVLRIAYPGYQAYQERVRRRLIPFLI
jgi:protein-S-isoprenylcysteine O-methyltransferase Ste14